MPGIMTDPSQIRAGDQPSRCAYDSLLHNPSSVFRVWAYGGKSPARNCHGLGDFFVEESGVPLFLRLFMASRGSV